MKSRIITLSKKEFIHIFRDPRTIGVVVFIPIFLLFLFGYALTIDVKHLSTALIDNSRTNISRQFISKFSNSGYFDIRYRPENVSQVKALMDSGKIHLAIIIPEDFSKKILSGNHAEMQTIYDGVNSNTASIARSYVDAITAEFFREKLKGMLEKRGLDELIKHDILKYDPRFWFNPTLESMNFLVPGLICVILTILSALLTSMTIVSEREKGTIEKLIVSPVKTYELILGKLIPYIFIAFFDILLVIAIGNLWFGVAIKGNLLLLFALSFVFLFSSLGIGLIISTIARSGQEAYIIALLVSMLPSILLSGFHFPIASMPLVLRGISLIVPARYYLVIIRGIFMKGIGFQYLWPSTLALLIFGTALVLLSTWRFKRKID